MRACHYFAAFADVAPGRKYGHSGDTTTNCSRLQHAILTAYYGADRVPQHGLQGYAALMLAGHSPPSTANVDEVVRLGLGEHVGAPDGYGAWYVQGWRSLHSGHCFGLVRARGGHLAGELVLCEASQGSDWCRPVTWAEIVAEYPAARSLCRLVTP